MYKENSEVKKNIESIIDKDERLGITEKVMWKSIFKELSNYQEDKYKEIKDSVSKERKIPQKGWVLKTALTKETEHINQLKWNYIAKENEFLYKEGQKLQKDGDRVILASAYLNCRLSEVKKITGYAKEYYGRVISGGQSLAFAYRIILKNSFISEEKALFDLAQLYNIESPVIYAPMLRRFVYIEAENTDGIFDRGFEKIELEFDKNGLENKVLTNYMSVWNLSCNETTPSTVVRASVDGEKIRAEYSCTANQFISFSNCKSTDEIIKNDASTTISYIDDERVANADRYDFSTDSSNALVADGFVFENLFAPSVEISRIKSLGDLELVLSAFKDLIELDKVVLNDFEDFTVCEYDRHFKYKELEGNYLINSKKHINLKFKAQDDTFFEDKIIYVINYLRNNYPEYSWKGGY